MKYDYIYELEKQLEIDYLKMHQWRQGNEWRYRDNYDEFLHIWNNMTVEYGEKKRRLESLYPNRDVCELIGGISGYQYFETYGMDEKTEIIETAGLIPVWKFVTNQPVFNALAFKPGEDIYVSEVSFKEVQLRWRNYRFNGRNKIYKLFYERQFNILFTPRRD